MSQTLQATIDAAWENRAALSAINNPEVVEAVEQVMADLDRGALRVATRDGVGQWTTHQWIKKAVLLSFRLKDNSVVRAGDLGFYDKVPTKFAHMDEADMRATGVRVVPPAVARRTGPAERDCNPSTRGRPWRTTIRTNCSRPRVRSSSPGRRTRT